MNLFKIGLIVFFAIFICATVWFIFKSGSLIDTGKNKKNEK